MKYLIAVDLEGVNKVVGEPYKGLGDDCFDYATAVNEAALEVNAAIKALFDGGATEVDVWDNHGGGNNIDFCKIDKRAKQIIDNLPCVNRLEFCENKNYDGIVFIGYHSKEGAIGGILSHTYNSSAIQYIKVGGKPYGEFEIDATIASKYGIKPLFASGDDVFINEVKAFSPTTVTVETKKAISRNDGVFYDEKTVLNNIYNGVLKSIKSDVKIAKIPLPAKIEIRYTRTERAKEVALIQQRDYNRNFIYGEDAHVITCNCYDIDDLKHSIIT